MAIVGNTLLTFDAKGIREQLSDVIYNISPTETLLVSMLPKTRATNTLFEWQTDSLAATDTTNAQLEGDDIATFPAIAVTARVGNYQQISRKLLVISGTEEAVNKAGRASEIAYQTAKRGKELKRDMEAIIFAAQAGVAGNSTTARKTAALNAWVKTNTDFGASGGDPTYTAGVPAAVRTDGTLRAFTETIMKTVIQEMWTSGGDVDASSLFVGPYNKGVASGFAGVATKNVDVVRAGQAAPGVIIGAADVYVSNFGVLRILPSRHQRERDAWFLNTNYLALPHLRPFRREALAKTGDAAKRMLLVEWGLEVKQEAALGLAADLSTA
jgi:hypothetical protein